MQEGSQWFQTTLLRFGVISLCFQIIFKVRSIHAHMNIPGDIGFVSRPPTSNLEVLFVERKCTTSLFFTNMGRRTRDARISHKRAFSGYPGRRSVQQWLPGGIGVQASKVEDTPAGSLG